MPHRGRLAGVILSALSLSVASGSARAAPQLRAQVAQRGDFVLVGNTLGHDCAALTPAPVVGTVGACGANTGDSAPDLFWRADSPSPGQAEAHGGVTAAQARSTAVLALPAGAEVTHAFLYWGAIHPAAGSDPGVILDRPGGFSAEVTALRSFQLASNAYQSVADVTALVQANGPGPYRVAGVDSVGLVDLNYTYAFAAWWMAVFYSLGSDPPRHLALLDGLDAVQIPAPQTATLSGFLVPPAIGAAKLGVVAFDGDPGVTGDAIAFNGAALSDARNPATDFFNGTRSALGAAVSVAGDLPQLTGTAGSMGGIDLDVVDVTSRLASGQTSATVSATTTGDFYLLAGLVVSLPSHQPVFSTSVMTAAGLSGGPLLAGDQLRYSATVTNTGNDAAVGVVLSVPLPPDVTYVPGSLQVTAGANTGAKTDGGGDDQAQYEIGTRTVTFRLGAGAGGVQGGSLAVGASTTVAFRVAIDAGVVGPLSTQGTITAAGQTGLPAFDTPTDGNGAEPGAPPTTVLVDGCADDLGCAAPTPRCDTAATPRRCVACLVDADCAGAVPPTCHPTARVCGCVSTGSEVCGNAIDEDCDGTLDNGCGPGEGGATGCGCGARPGGGPEPLGLLVVAGLAWLALARPRRAGRR